VKRIVKYDRLAAEANLGPELEQKGETTMKRYSRVFAALAMSLMSSALIPSLKASETDKKTIIAISRPVAVQGTILPVGQYVLKLQTSSASRDVVYIFNAKETRLITTILAMHAYRMEPTGQSEFKFYESPAGQPAALHTWFYPGDNSGFEFQQPRHPVAVDSNVAVAN
jgi:hypothetical protein